MQALQAMQFGVPSVHTDLTDLDGEFMTEAHGKAFRQALEHAVMDPAFPGADFVRAVAARVTQSHRHWLDSFHARDAQVQRVEKRLERELQAKPSPGRRRTLLRRFGRAACGNTKNTAQQDAALQDSVFTLMLFDSMGKAALLAPDAVRALLAVRQHRYLALKAIEQAGPAAAEFLQDLAPPGAELDPEVTAAVGAIGAGDPKVVAQMCQQIEAAMAKASEVSAIPPTGSPEFHQLFYGRSAWGPARVLARMGPAARMVPGVGPTVIPRLLALSRSPMPGQRAAATHAMACCVAGDDPQAVRDVLDRLLELTHDHSWVAATAIDALGTLHVEPGRSVARLVELFDSFEEFDSDMGYGGSHARVCDALSAFGAGAAPALPRVMREMESALAARTRDSDEWPADLLKVLEAMGPAAAPALPILQRFRDAFDGREEQIDAVTASIDRA